MKTHKSKVRTELQILATPAADTAQHNRASFPGTNSLSRLQMEKKPTDNDISAQSMASKVANEARFCLPSTARVQYGSPTADAVDGALRTACVP